jgi:hypothetical protein
VPSPAPSIVPERVQQPPRPLSEIKVVPLAPSREPERREEVYEGDEPGTPWSDVLGPVWRWTRRVVVVGALAAGAWFGWTERAAWLPRAAVLGQGLFGEIDRQVLSRTRGEQQEQALAAASAQLPQLAPDTIRILFARNPLGVEEASDVFQAAREAADRGRASLPAAEAEELGAIEQQALAALSRSERARVEEYDRTRERRAIFPFENPHVMQLVARAARSLPPERRERLQQLTHGAVVAGLAQGPEAPAAASVDAPGSSR